MKWQWKQSSETGLPLRPAVTAGPSGQRATIDGDTAQEARQREGGGTEISSAGNQTPAGLTHSVHRRVGHGNEGQEARELVTSAAPRAPGQM